MKTVAILVLAALASGCRTVTPEERTRREEAETAQRVQRQLAKEAEHALAERRRNTLKGWMVKHHPWTTGLSNVTYALYYPRSRDFEGTPVCRPLGAYLNTLLAQQGWTATASTNAEYYVLFDWRRESEDFSEQKLIPKRGLVGGGTSYEHGTAWTPNGPQSYSGTVTRPLEFGVTGYKTQTTHSTIFAWELTAEVYRASDRRHLFKGNVRCVSTSYRDEISVVAGLLDAMFESFPGRDAGIEGAAFVYPHSLPVQTPGPTPP